MSKLKAKKVKELAALPEDKKWKTIQYGSPLHAEAHAFKDAVYNGFWLKANPHTVPKKQHKWIRFHNEKSLAMLRTKFLDAYNRKDGSFFRALADMLEPGNPAYSEWSALEKYIHTQCSFSNHIGEDLPSPAQIQRGWKMKCGIFPQNTNDVKLWWKSVSNEPLPSKKEIERVFRNHHGPQNSSAGHVQIKEIIQAARNVGFPLPTKKCRKFLPAGMGMMRDGKHVLNATYS